MKSFSSNFSSIFLTWKAREQEDLELIRGLVDYAEREGYSKVESEMIQKAKDRLAQTHFDDSWIAYYKKIQEQENKKNSKNSLFRRLKFW
jgi:hypothetical protein